MQRVCYEQGLTAIVRLEAANVVPEHHSVHIISCVDCIPNTARFANFSNTTIYILGDLDPP